MDSIQVKNAAFQTSNKKLLVCLKTSTLRSYEGMKAGHSKKTSKFQTELSVLLWLIHIENTSQPMTVYQVTSVRGGKVY